MDYPCLYYVNGKVNDKTVCKFLCGLGTIFGLKASEISDSSKLFAATSRVLFNGKGFSKEEVEKHGQSVFERPFNECKKLSKWRIISELDLPTNCCIICPLSTTYKNNRMDSERMVLRGSLHTGNPTGVLPNEGFFSVISVNPGNDVSNYPLIPLFKMLNKYIAEQSEKNHGPYDDKEELIKLFSDYVCEQLSYTDAKHKKDIFACVKREINILYEYDLSTLNDYLVNVQYMNITSPYTYNAPKIMKPNSSSETPPVIPVKKKTYKKKPGLPNQKNLLDSEDVSNNLKNDKVQSKDKTKTNINKSSISSLPNKVNEPVNNTVNKVNEEINNIVDNDSNKNVSVGIDDISVININNIEREDGLGNYKVTSILIKEIFHCTDDNANSVYNFITDICSSQYVGAESIVLNNSPGLLLRTCSSNKYYFFDIKYAPPSYLYPALSDASKLKILSLKPLPVISMLATLGFTSLQVESLSGLYYIANEYKEINGYEEIFSNELSIGNENMKDFYYHYMPYYEKLYKRLIKKLNENSDKTLYEKYNHGINLDSVLGKYYDLSDIVYELNNSISGHGFFDYQFNYNKDIPFIKKGILYIINLDIEVEDENSLSDFFEEVAIQVNRTSLVCVKHAKLIAFVDRGIMYYSTMHGDAFFDILIDAVRKNFKKYYSLTPILKTYRVEYN